MSNNYLELIERLTSAPGAPGFEDEVATIAAAYARDNGFAQTRESNIRNLYLYRRGNTGNKPVLMLDAHSDEVAFIVQAIRPCGTLQFLELGGISREKIQGTRVLVRNAEGRYIPGVVTSISNHYKGVDADICIDVGAVSKEDAVRRFGIRLGEPAVPDVPFYYDADNDIFMAKALDCRIGCAALLAVLQALAGEDLPFDVVGSLTAQEEIGDRGALVAAQTFKPSAAIVFEGAPADDTFAPDYAVQTALGRGPMLRHIDNSMVSNPRFTRFALNIAAGCGIPVQEAVRAGGGTNGGCIHTFGEGVPSIVLSVPVRYAHSPCGISCYSDFEATVKLAADVIRALSPRELERF